MSSYLSIEKWTYCSGFLGYSTIFSVPIGSIITGAIPPGFSTGAGSLSVLAVVEKSF
jgi:hypothetical protein